jgi:hypothetical protein
MIREPVSSQWSFVTKNREGFSPDLDRCWLVDRTRGLCMDNGLEYFVAGGTGLWLGVMMQKINLKDPESCLWWFQNGGVAVGGTWDCWASI